MKTMYYVLTVSVTLLMLGCSQGIYNQGRTSKNGTPPAIGNSANMSWEKTDTKEQNRNSNALRRLESLKWDSVKHQLTWDVSRGEKKETHTSRALMTIIRLIWTTRPCR